jgi:MFS family permease
LPKQYVALMRKATAAALVFLAGFIIMVLEIIGARFLAKDFGSSFHVWVSQIGVVLIALTLGYYLGGALADRWQRLSILMVLLAPTSLGLYFIPSWSKWLIDAIILRHPQGEPVPVMWQKLDPVLGSMSVFLIPCAALATLSPYMIRLATQSLAQVGRSSGFIIASSTLGSIVGVFVAGLIFIDYLRLSTIFRLMGAMTMLLGLLCVSLDRCLVVPTHQREEGSSP